MTTPPGALTWRSSARRNRLLKVWRREVFARFGEQARCVRVACVLMDLFNVKRGYAFATNPYLAEETCIAVNKIREALGILESGRAIMRTNIINPATGQKQRVIYPAIGIMPRPALGQGEGAPTWGGGGEPRQPGHQNLRRIPSIQSSQIALAKAESARRDERERHGERGPASAPELAPAPVAAPEEGCPNGELTRDGQRSLSTEQGARATEIERRVGGEVDDGIPEFLRRKAKGAAGDRPRDADGGMALDLADHPDGRMQTEEEDQWTL